MCVIVWQTIRFWWSHYCPLKHLVNDSILATWIDRIYILFFRTGLPYISFYQWYNWWKLDHIFLIPQRFLGRSICWLDQYQKWAFCLIGKSRASLFAYSILWILYNLSFEKGQMKEEKEGRGNPARRTCLTTSKQEA